MSKFMRISSVSKTNAVDMFTLGVTTSRGKQDKIGQFGSGSLMAVLLWLREFGESPIFCLNGEKITFEANPVPKSDGEVFHQVTQKMGRKKQILTVALEHGAIDWKEPRMALREWISNAIDNGADIRTAIEFVDKIDAPENEVCVFIPMNGECRKYWQEIDTHFLHFVGKEKETVIEKDTISPCRVYRRGVFIRELDRSSLYDYNLDFSIDESRNGSSDSIVSKIVEMAHNTYNSPNGPESYYENMLTAVRTYRDCMEVREQSWRSSLGAEWKKPLQKLVDSGVKFGNEMSNEKDVVKIPSEWYLRFTTMFPELDSLKDKSAALSDGHSMCEVPDNTSTLFDGLVDLIALMGLTNGKDKPTLSVFKTKDGQPPKCLGYYKNGDVSIWKDATNSKQTILEELCHHYSGQRDCTRGFQEYNLRLITEMSTWFK